jgi:hypothetical protein
VGDSTARDAINAARAHGGPELGATVLAEVTGVIAAAGPAIAQVPQAHFLFTDDARWFVRATTRSHGNTTT